MKTNRICIARVVFLIIAGRLLGSTTVYVPDGTVGTSSNSFVGIGTSSPSRILHILDTSLNQPQILVENTSTYGIRFGLNSSNVGFVGSTNATPVQLQTNGTARLYIGITGNVGIGTTSPVGLLTISSSAAVNNQYVRFENTEVGHTRIWNLGMATASSGSFVLNDLSAGAERLRIDTSGNVGIGTSSPSYKLAVNGTVRAKEVIVDTGWSDYVFADDYRLAPLSEVEQHIKAEKHLPDIPSAAEVEKGGISLGQMQAKLLAKIEELTLHQIEQEKRLNEQDARIEKLQSENARLRAQ